MFIIIAYETGNSIIYDNGIMIDSNKNNDNLDNTNEGNVNDNRKYVNVAISNDYFLTIWIIHSGVDYKQRNNSSKYVCVRKDMLAVHSLSKQLKCMLFQGHSIQHVIHIVRCSYIISISDKK